MKIPLTSSRLKIPKKPFNNLTNLDISHFKSILGNNSVLTDQLDLFNEDWSKKFRGVSSLVLKPSTTDQVSQILKHCYNENLAVVTQGGNTSLVGGSVPVFDEIILNTSNMNKITSFDKISGILSCQPGCILQTLDEYCSQFGYIMPLDLGAKGSCQIGGNVASNAGGLRLLRYGSLHANVLALEVVKADGTIMSLGQPLRKDNTGYDLKHLFIGSEGTLGVITNISILTPRKPTLVLALKNFEDVQKTFVFARSKLNEVLSAFEFWDSSASHVVSRNLSKPIVPDYPFSELYPFHVLIETSGNDDSHDKQILEDFLCSVLENEICVDGILAESETQAQSLWSLRECISEACARDGHGGNLKYDLSVPVPRLYELVEVIRKRIDKSGLYSDPTRGRVVAFGHIGDGNLHLNITGAGFDGQVENLIEPFIYEWVSEAGGSVSAEHGLGVQKAKCISYSKSNEAIQAMHDIKNMWDPKGILNPYKLLQ